MTINLWNKQQMHLNPASLFGRQLHVALPEGFTSYTPIIGAMGPYLWLVFVPTLLWNFYIKPGRFMNTACSSVLVVPPVLVLPPRLHSMLELSKQKGVVYRKHPSHKWFATWVGVTGSWNFKLHPWKLTWIPKMAIFKRNQLFQTIFLGSMLVFGGVPKTNSEF